MMLYAKNQKGLESLVQTVRIFSDDIYMEYALINVLDWFSRRGKLQSLMEFYCLMEES